MRSCRTALAAALLFVAGAAVAAPYAVYFYPCGIQAGTTRRIVAGGQGLYRVRGGWITGGGVEIVRVMPVPGFPRARGKGQAKWMKDWFYELVDGTRSHHELPPQATTEDSDWHPNPWWYNMEKCDDVELAIVGRDMFVPKNDLQASPSLADLVILDIKAAPDAKPGRRDIILYDDNGVSVPYSFFVSSEPRIAEPLYQCPYAIKKHGEAKLDPIAPPVAFDGQIFPGETDVFYLRLKKGKFLTCAVTGRELLPFLGDAVPGFFNPIIHLFDPQDNEIACADDFFYLPDPVLTCQVPEDGVYRLEIHDNLYRGRSDFVYAIDCVETDEEQPLYTPQERAFKCFPPPAAQEVPQEDDLTVVRSGVLECPGRVVRHYFNVTRPYSRYRMELFARRQGSPLDGVLKLYGPVGTLPISAAPLLATWDDSPAKLYDVRNLGSEDQPIIKTNLLFTGSVLQVERDPAGQYTFEQPGRYCVTVSDISEAGGEDYTYTLAISPVEPTFEVYGTASAYLLSPDDYAANIKLRVLRLNGFKGPVRLDSTEDVEADSYEIDDIKGDSGLVLRKKGWRGVKCIQLTASAWLPNGKKKTVRITPTDPAEQAFAYTHLVPQPGFFFCVPPEKEPEIVQAGERKRGADHANGQACSKCHDDGRKK